MIKQIKLTREQAEKEILKNVRLTKADVKAMSNEKIAHHFDENYLITFKNKRNGKKKT